MQTADNTVVLQKWAEGKNAAVLCAVQQQQNTGQASLNPCKKSKQKTKKLENIFEVPTPNGRFSPLILAEHLHTVDGNPWVQSAA